MFANTLSMLRYQGPQWLAFRAGYALKQRLGWFERTCPNRAWSDRPDGTLRRDLAMVPSRFVPGASPKEILEAADRSQAIARADRILSGRLSWFSAYEFDAGFPPDWFADPWTSRPSVPDLRHWSRLDEFAATDIKVLWEQGRFGFVFPLVRAFAASGDPRYVEGYWRALEDWRAKNPPQRGPHWKCGQEIALRLMALVFGFMAFRQEPAATPEREAMLAEVVDLSARRIEANIAYALSQCNNHGVSEAAGLYTAGIVLQRPRWIDRGERLLARLANALIYDDGSFSQHSTNYHRLMLHGYLWALSLGKAAGHPLPSQIADRVRRAGAWLRTLMDPTTGRVPNLGANDGAHFLDLTDLGYLDYRPTVQAVGAIIDGHPWLPAGPWDELAAWLGVDAAGSTGRSLGCAPEDRPDVSDQWRHLAQGGYAVFRRGTTMALFRCPTRFRHRPAHCDLLHLDLWHRGTNVLRDGGTYSYHCEAPWRDYFPGTAAHNTVQFDDHEQMPRLSRFLFGHWPSLTAETGRSGDGPSVAAGFVDWRGCRHDRSVVATADGFRIVDRIEGFREKAVLRWRLAPEWDWTLDGDTCRSEACTIRVHAEPGRCVCERTTGWESLYYLQRTQLPVLQATVASGAREFVTEVVLRP